YRPMSLIIFTVRPNDWLLIQHSISYFFIYSFANNRDLYSFPTRRSSDLLFFQALLNISGAGLASATSSAEIIVSKEAGSTSECSDRKSTRLNSSHVSISYAVFCLKKKNEIYADRT